MKTRKSIYRILPSMVITILFAFTLLSAANAQVPYGNNDAAGKYIQVNGVRHYYEVYGAGQPLLLIHGNGTGIKGWGPQIDYFSKKYTVYAIDCRGRGKSDPGKDSLTYLQMAKDMATFIELMKLDSVDIIGKSDGGIIGIMMGIYYPQHIRKIVAFGANMWPDSTALVAQSVNEGHDERVHAEKMIAAHDTTKNWSFVRWQYRLMEFQPHLTANDLHKINIPVLVFSCDRDLIKEEHTMFIYKNIPHASLAMLSGENHFVAKQNPELFNKTADKFLSTPFAGDELRFKR